MLEWIRVEPRLHDDATAGCVVDLTDGDTNFLVFDTAGFFGLGGVSFGVIAVFGD